jgi:hypothetical protein
MGVRACDTWRLLSAIGVSWDGRRVGALWRVAREPPVLVAWVCVRSTSLTVLWCSFLVIFLILVLFRTQRGKVHTSVGAFHLVPERGRRGSSGGTRREGRGSRVVVSAGPHRVRGRRLGSPSAPLRQRVAPVRKDGSPTVNVEGRLDAASNANVSASNFETSVLTGLLRRSA